MHKDYLYASEMVNASLVCVLRLQMTEHEHRWTHAFSEMRHEMCFFKENNLYCYFMNTLHVLLGRLVRFLISVDMFTD